MNTTTTNTTTMKKHTHPPFRAPRYETGAIYGHLEIIDNGAAEECYARRILRVRCVVCGFERASKEASVDVCVRRKARGCSKCSHTLSTNSVLTELAVIRAVRGGFTRPGGISRAIGHAKSYTTLARVLERLVRSGRLVRTYGPKGATYAAPIAPAPVVAVPVAPAPTATP